MRNLLPCSFLLFSCCIDQLKLTFHVGKEAKQGRGQGKCNWFLNNKKESVDLSPFGRVISDNSPHFSRYMGILARDANLIPIKYLKWEKVPDSCKLDVWDTLRVWFS